MITIINVPKGAVGWIVENKKVVRVLLDKSQAEIKRDIKKLHVRKVDKTDIAGLTEKFEKYFLGKPVAFTDVNVDFSGYSRFAVKIYKTLIKEVGYGERITYGNLAVLAGFKSGYARAVGNVLAVNRTPIITPCHRVVKQDGGLGSYNQGEKWKKYLLELEQKGIS